MPVTIAAMIAVVIVLIVQLVGQYLIIYICPLDVGFPANRFGYRFGVPPAIGFFAVSVEEFYFIVRYLHIGTWLTGIIAIRQAIV